MTAKDLILYLIGQISTSGGTGYCIEYTGEAIRALSMEERMTVCNMTIEAGARAGLIAPDETTFDYLRGRPFRAAGISSGRRGLAEAAAAIAGAQYDRVEDFRRRRHRSRRSPGAPTPARSIDVGGECPIRPTSPTPTDRQSAQTPWSTWA